MAVATRKTQKNIYKKFCCKAKQPPAAATHKKHFQESKTTSKQWKERIGVGVAGGGEGGGGGSQVMKFAFLHEINSKRN